MILNGINFVGTARKYLHLGVSTFLTHSQSASIADRLKTFVRHEVFYSHTLTLELTSKDKVDEIVSMTGLINYVDPYGYDYLVFISKDPVVTRRTANRYNVKVELVHAQ